MNENKLKFSVDTERLFKLGPNFLQSKDGQKALADGSLKSEDRLFMALSSSTLLNTTLLLPGKKLIELGEQFDDLWHECLESSYGFLRASWPRNWLGMPFVLLECLRFLNLQENNLSDAGKSMLGAAQNVAIEIENQTQSRSNFTEPEYHN